MATNPSPNGGRSCGSTQDNDLVRDTIERHDIVAIMHFAAFAYVRESMTDPARYYENNVGGTMGLLKGMREQDAPPSSSP